MTATLRRKLMLLGKLASLTGALVGCKDDLKDRTFRLEQPGTVEQNLALVGRSRLGQYWQGIEFAEPLRFTRVGETVEAFGYKTLTLADFGEAHTGKYAMRATLRKGYTGGPAGSATEYVVDVVDARLVAKLVPPPAPPGKRGILPGEIVIRRIPAGELPRVDDRYLVELPAKVNAHVMFDPEPDKYDFKLSVEKDGTTLPLRYHNSAERFETASAGIHELRVTPAEAPAAREPDRYSFYVVWGEASIGSQLLPDEEIHWRPVADVSRSSRK
jgi:hypothetical protein